MRYIILQDPKIAVVAPDPSLLSQGAFLGILLAVLVQKGIERFFPTDAKDNKLIELLQKQNENLQSSLERNTEALELNQITLTQLNDSVKQMATAFMYSNNR